MLDGTLRIDKSFKDLFIELESCLSWKVFAHEMKDLFILTWIFPIYDYILWFHSLTHSTKAFRKFHLFLCFRLQSNSRRLLEFQAIVCSLRDEFLSRHYDQRTKLCTTKIIELVAFKYLRSRQLPNLNWSKRKKKKSFSMWSFIYLYW